MLAPHPYHPSRRTPQTKLLKFLCACIGVAFLLNHHLVVHVVVHTLTTHAPPSWNPTRFLQLVGRLVCIVGAVLELQPGVGLELHETSLELLCQHQHDCPAPRSQPPRQLRPKTCHPPIERSSRQMSRKTKDQGP